MSKIIKKLTIIIIVTTLLLCACSKKNEEVSPINIAIVDDVVSLDPANTKDLLSETVSRCIYSTLYTFDESMNLVPCLADSEKRISELEWMFKIKKDVKFHDGTDLSASDIKFSIERAMTVENAEKSLSIIDSIEVVDEHTLKVITTEPSSNLPSIFVRVSTSVMSEKAMQNSNYSLDKPVGSGPFKVIERIKGEKISLERFDNYFIEDSKSKYLNFVVEPSEQTSTSSLLNGKIDIIFRVSANDGDYLKLNDDIDMYQIDSTKMELLSLNTNSEPLNDIRIRKAIACAIDKQNLVDNVLSGYGRVQSSMIPAPLLGFEDFDEYKYDPEKANSLLEEAGYPNGFDFTIITFDAQRKKLMEYLKLDLAKVNIRLNYEFLELADYLKIIENGEHMGSSMSWTSNADPDSTFTQLYSKYGHITVNQSGYTDERVEELLQQGRMESDKEKRNEIYKEANKIIASSYNVIPLYQPAVLVAARKNISGIRVNPQGIFGYESIYKIENN